jgi:hypothetical protein
MVGEWSRPLEGRQLTGNGLMICLVLMLAIAAAYGFGVYLFSALIPQIRADLALSYATIGGWLAARQFGFVVTSLASGTPMRLRCAARCYSRRLGSRRSPGSSYWALL